MKANVIGRVALPVAVLLPMASMAEAESATALNQAIVAAHSAVARRAAGEGIVLLKNDGLLPLAKGTKVAVLGAHAEYRPGGEGSSKVKSVRTVDIPTGLAEAGLVVDPESRDVAVFVISRRSSEGGDRVASTFDLQGYERAGIDKAKKDGFRNIIVVFNCGGGINLKPLEEDPAIGAILWTWYPGGEGGAAVGDIVTGAVNPSGRLVATLAERLTDYSSDPKWMESRWYVPYEEDIFVGYRYFETIPGAKEKVVYPFGFGLSYTTWKLEVGELGMGNGERQSGKISVSVRVKNVGKVAGKRSVLCYTSQKGGKAEHPAIELRAFAKTKLLAPGETQTLTLSFATKDLAYFDDEGVSGHPGSWVVDCGEYTIWVGGSVRDVVKAGSFKMKNDKVLSTPGFKLHADRLARRLRSDGTYSESPVTYPGHSERPFSKRAPTNSADKVSITLFDVADGKATLDRFLDQMSFDEMLTLLYGHKNHGADGDGSIGNLAKYGITAAQTCDGPAGVRRALPSTFFPCAALLACSFDPALLREVGGAIGAEAAEADFDVLLAPGLCIHRHPLCGRNFEYFSEDPLVSGVCAAEYVKGVQSQGVGATVKHFAGNEREALRKIEKDIVSERAFREIYLRGFERAIKEADPWCVMSAYNGVNGFNCGENYGLITGILRGEWGFKGLTMTDWSTTVPIWREIGAGNDVKMPGVLLDTQGKIKILRDLGTEESQFARERDYLSVTMVRESARRVCELVMKTRRFAREREEARR